MTPYPTRRRIGLAAVLALIAALPALAGVAVAAEAPRLEAAEVKRLAEKKDVVIVDVRGKDAYDQEHAVGAIHIPIDQFETRVSELPKDKLIAAYCT